jgi:hypothetical protein
MSCNLHKDEQVKVVNNLENFKSEKCYIIDTNEESYRKKNAFPKFPIDSTNRHTKQTNSGPYFLIGSLRINNLGELDTLSDNSECLFPINYACSRIYWSTTDIGKKVSYKCRIITTSILKSEGLLNYKNESAANVQTEEMINSDLPNVSNNFKMDIDANGISCEKIYEENVISEPFELLPQQVDGQNDNLEENAYKPSLIINNTNVTTNIFNINTTSFMQQSNQMTNQSKCIIRMPNSQTIFTNLNQTSQPTKILSYNNASSNPHILQTNPKVFNISSQFKSFSNIKTGSNNNNNPTTNIQLPYGTDKPPVMRIENPPVVRIDNPPTIRYENSLSANIPKTYSSVNTVQPKKNKSSVKKSVLNMKKSDTNNHLKSLEVSFLFALIKTKIK